MSTEAELDAKSQPFRDALNLWARENDIGFGGGWERARGVWSYDVWRVGGGETIAVAIEEDGSKVTIRFDGESVVARTPRTMRMALTRIERRRIAGERKAGT